MSILHTGNSYPAHWNITNNNNGPSPHIRQLFHGLYDTLLTGSRTVFFFEEDHFVFLNRLIGTSMKNAGGRGVRNIGPSQSSQVNLLILPSAVSFTKLYRMLHFLKFFWKKNVVNIIRQKNRQSSFKNFFECRPRNAFGMQVYGLQFSNSVSMIWNLMS